MIKRYSRLVLGIAVAAALLAADGLAADGVAADGAAQEKKATGVAGQWTLNVDSPHGATDMGLLLKQEGKKVTGTFASPHGDLPVEGEFADATLTLATTSTQPEAPQVTFTAKLKDDGTLAGYLSAPMGDMKWTGKRSK